jgi:hypothetical protein
MTDLPRSCDDFSGFVGSEHMFFGLDAPYATIRAEAERCLQEQVADASLESIRMQGAPRFLTIGRRTDDPSKVIVGHFAFCLRATLDVRSNHGLNHDLLDVCLTFLFGDVDRRGSERSASFFDVGAAALTAYDEEVFKQRFLAFRASLG